MPNLTLLNYKNQLQRINQIHLSFQTSIHPNFTKLYYKGFRFTIIE